MRENNSLYNNKKKKRGVRSLWSEVHNLPPLPSLMRQLPRSSYRVAQENISPSRSVFPIRTDTNVK